MKPVTGQVALEGWSTPAASLEPLRKFQSIWDTAKKIGQKKQRVTFVASAISAAVLLSMAWGLVGGLGRFWLGLVLGLIYANGFEYVYHRWILHGTHTGLAARHAGHHEHWGNDDEPAHSSFGDSVAGVIALLLANSIPFLAADSIWGFGISVGIVAAFHIYFMLVEHLHWAIHVEPLPRTFRWVRQYHFAHHAQGDCRFNVFFPLFDLLLGTYRPRKSFR